MLLYGNWSLKSTEFFFFNVKNMVAAHMAESKFFAALGQA